jgi:hypothetical protein
MAIPPAGVAEPHPTNMQETQIIERRTRNGEIHAAPEGTGRITTREVWKLIHEFKDIINH